MTEETVLAWVKDRPNYVEPMKTVLMRWQDPSKFGWTTKGFDGRGELKEVRWQILMEQFHPVCLEIIGSPNPAAEVIKKLTESNMGIPLLGQLKHLRISECRISMENLSKILSWTRELCCLDFCDFGLDTEEMKSLLYLLTTTKLKALDMSYPYSQAMLSAMGSCGLAQNIRLLRFSAPVGLTPTAVKQIPGEIFPAVELIALQDLDLPTIPQVQEITLILEHFNSWFPALKHFYFDWKVLSDEVEFNEETILLLKELLKLHSAKNFWSTSILTYMPTDSMREAVDRISDFIRQTQPTVTLRQIKFNTVTTLGDTRGNFCLTVIGDFQVGELQSNCSYKIVL